MRPVVIAHRGASGHLPEHTLPAKALAYAMGADYLEQDIVATRDDQLVVLHDIHLDRVTDVARVFPGRARGDGRYYARDFDLEEILALKVHERTDARGQRVFAGRFPSAGEDFRVHTLSRELELVADLCDNGAHPVGIYPESLKRLRSTGRSLRSFQAAANGVNVKARESVAAVDAMRAAEKRAAKLRKSRSVKEAKKAIDGRLPVRPSGSRTRTGSDASSAGAPSRAPAAVERTSPSTRPAAIG